MLKEWYAVRSLFYDILNRFYEERTVMILANNHDEAIDKAEEYANGYVLSLGDMEFSGYSETFKLVDDDIGNIVEFSEVYSCMRYSNLSPEQYVKRFLKTGDEVNLE